MVVQKNPDPDAPGRRGSSKSTNSYPPDRSRRRDLNFRRVVPPQSAELAGGPSHVEILVGEAAGVMGHQGQPDLVVADVDVGMMSRFFG